MVPAVFPRRSPRNHPTPNNPRARFFPQQQDFIWRNLEDAFNGTSSSNDPPPQLPAVQASRDVTTQSPSAAAREKACTTTSSPSPYALRSTCGTTQPPEGGGQRWSELPTTTPAINATRSSDLYKGGQKEVAPLSADMSHLPSYERTNCSSDLSTIRPSRQAAIDSGESTIPPARRYSEMSTKKPRAELYESVRGTAITERLPCGRNFSDMTTQSPSLAAVVLQGEIHVREDHGNSDLHGEGHGIERCNEDPITPAVESIQVARSIDPLPELTTQEILPFAFNFIEKHTDAVLRKVLKCWQRIVIGSKMERIACAYLYFRVCLSGGGKLRMFSANVRKTGCTSLPLEIIDPSPPPPTPVTGAKLKTMWTDMRGPYTKSHKDFEKSGQYDPTIGETLRFLKKKESGQGRGGLYALSKRILVMFIVMLIGSDNAGNDDQGATTESMLDMTLRMIPNGEGFDEAGSRSMFEGYGSDEEDDVRSMGSRKKRKTAELSADMKVLCQHIQGLTDSIKGREECGDDQEIAKIEARVNLLELLQRAQDQLRSAQDKAVGDDDVLVKLTIDQFESIREKYQSTFVPAGTAPAT